MAPRSDEPRPAARVALVGATSPAAAGLRKLLENRRVPGSRVDLYGTAQGEAAISGYAGEARLVQEPDIDEIVRHEVVFLCETGDVGRRIAAALEPGPIVIDLVDGLPDRDRAALVHLDLKDAKRGERGGLFVVPHPVALLLAELLHPIEREFGIVEAVAIVLRPAADFGEPAVEELREQVVRLLNFAEVPVETFGRQLAFNVIRQSGLALDEPGREPRIAQQVSRLLGWSDGALALRMIATPVFHGHALQVRLKLADRVPLDRLKEVTSAAGFFAMPGGGSSPTPLDLSIERLENTAEWSEDGVGGFWVWAVAGDGERKAADQAFRLARSHYELTTK